tara:strand:- start:23 stop:205 length:183 start_codon:yes stop_codon:yes gene_type:complete
MVALVKEEFDTVLSSESDECDALCPTPPSPLSFRVLSCSTEVGFTSYVALHPEIGEFVSS